MEWARSYDEARLLERHGYRTPAQVRRDFIARKVAA